MKRKFISIFIALVLALSLCLVTAVPAVAAEGESIFTVASGTYTTTLVDPENGTIAATLTGTWGDSAVIGDFSATGTGGLYVVDPPPGGPPPWYGSTATISVDGILSEVEITFSGTATWTAGDPITDDEVTNIYGTVTIESDGVVVADLTGDIEGGYTVDIDISGSMVVKGYVFSGDSIQDAIDAADPGDTIIVAVGTYAEALFIDDSLILLGAKASQDARTRDTDSGESIVDGSGLDLDAGVGAFNIADGVSNVMIDGFEICNWPASANPGNGSAVMAYSFGEANQGLSQVTIQNNYMHDLGWNGVLVWSNNDAVQDDFTIQFNLIEQAPYAAIELTNVINSQVRDNKIIAPTVIAYDPGDAGVGIEIAVRAQPGVIITAGTDVLVEGNEISGTFAEGSRAAINILSRAYASDSVATLTGVTVKGNIVSTNVIVGILAVAESREGTATISNLRIVDDNIVSGFSKTGIVAKDVDSVHIEGNTVSTTEHGLATNGIQVGYGATTGATGTVKDNQVSGCQWGEYDPTLPYEYWEGDEPEDFINWTGSGILVVDTESALEISGNEVQGCDVGLDIEAGSGTLITNNDVHDNSYGFVLWDANPTINYNDIYQNALCGVYRTTVGSLEGTLDATKNWWGDAVTTTNAIEPLISGTVDYSPWLVTSPITGTAPNIGVSEHPWTWYTNDSIQDVIDAAAVMPPPGPFDTINVVAETYNEAITIDRGLTLQGTQAGEDPTVEGARTAPAEESTIQGSGGTVVTIISADGVVIDGFTITNPSGKHGICAQDQSDITITNNIVTDVGSSDGSASGTNQGIAILSSAGGAAVDKIIIADNRISYIVGGISKSADGIVIGHSDGDYNITGLLIQNNVISNITSATVAFAEGGKGAYGIKLSHGTGTTGKTVDAQVLDNTISDLEGLWAHGIGLEGNTPGAVVERNDISHLIDHKTPSDAVAVQVEDNASADTVGIHFNNFYNLNVGVQNVTGTEVDATLNWWGTAIESQIAKMVSGSVDYSPWLDVAYPGGESTFVDVTAIGLKSGWNLISLPLIPDVSAIETVLAGTDVNKVAYYTGDPEGPEGGWLYYTTGAPEISELTEMQDGKGYWIDMSTAGALTIRGYELCAPPPEVPPSYDLVKGWNLIGFKSLATDTVTAYFGSAVTGTMEAMYGYDAAAGLYTIILAATDLVPGQGYWLAVSAEGTIYP